MIRGMYAGISGMKSQQTKLDVIGNNLANVGTTSFKNSRVVFKDILYQNDGVASSTSEVLGGTNPKQVGLGSAVGSVDKVMSQGMMQPTGRSLDVAIDGEGYFMVSKGKVAHNDTDITLSTEGKVEKSNGREIFYTRDGSLSLDPHGYLVTSGGERVLGYSPKDGMEDNGDINFVDVNTKDLKTEPGLKTLKIPNTVKGKNGTGEKKIMSYSIGKDGVISGVVEGGGITFLGQLAVASFKNPPGLEAVGNNLYLNSANSGEAVVSSGFGETNSRGSGGEIMQGMLEMSNVDIAEQFSDLIVTSRAFQASSKIVTTTDEILQEVVNLKR